MDETLQKLEDKIEAIKERNQRVEADKAWETSWTRRLVILVMTYCVIVIFFYGAELAHPFKNAVVPALAFMLSSITVPLFKSWWIKKNYKK